MSLLRSEILVDNKDTAKSGWNSNPFNAEKNFSSSIQSGLALNAMPTPFARAEVVKQAFEVIENFNEAGYTYQQIVSDTLDIIEILFQYELYSSHIKIQKLILSQLQFPNSNTIIDKGAKKEVSLFQDMLNKHKMSDNAYLITYTKDDTEYVLAMSSPHTLFFTSSRLDREEGKSNEYGLQIDKKDNSGEKFFGKPKSFNDRSQEFQDYMYHLLCQNKAIFGNTTLGAFIANALGNQKTDSFDAESIKPLQDAGHAQVSIPLNGNNTINLYANNKPQSTTVLRDTLVDLGFKINSDKFVTIPSYDTLLLPLNIRAFDRIKDDNFVSDIKYSGMEIEAGEYKLTNRKEHKVDRPIDIGVYPFIKYPEDYIQQNVATYNIVLAYQHGNLQNNAIELRFFTKDGKELPVHPRSEYQNETNGLNKCVIREIRTDENDPNKLTERTNQRTIHYTIIGSNFDYIQIDFDKEGVSGVLKPIFTDPGQKNDNIKFAVDFGTTSTYVAVKEGGNNPYALQTEEESMVYLHKGAQDNQQKVYRHEKYSDNTSRHAGQISELVKLIKNEFIPSSIDGDAYKFPIRTAISHKNAGAAEDIFEDANIAFTYDREAKVGNNSYLTNIKWDIRDNLHSSLYIREIIRICVIHAIAKGYRRDAISFLYFYPLAMNRDKSNAIKDVWKNGCREFGLNAGCVTSMTESLAPYYAVMHDDASCVASIDIGGGSVDMVVYRDRKPQFAMSSLFGCDVLWSGGKDTANNSKSNPIYNSLKAVMDEKVAGKKELLDIHKAMTEVGSSNSSVDIINFWISNDEHLNISKELRLEKYCPMFIGHFYAIIYHLAQAMKAKGLPTPKEVAMSGNGSLYLTYLDQHWLSQIATAAFRAVFEVAPDDIKVVLPQDNNFKGKEMTAVGGLGFNDEQNVEPYIYLGGKIDFANEEFVNNVEKVAPNGVLDESLVNSIADNVCSMEEHLLELFKEMKIKVSDFKSTQSEHRTTIKESIEHPDSNYKSDSEVATTFFFAPLRHMIFKIEEEIVKKSNQTRSV